MVVKQTVVTLMTKCVMHKYIRMYTKLEILMISSLEVIDVNVTENVATN